MSGVILGRSKLKWLLITTRASVRFKTGTEDLSSLIPMMVETCWRFYFFIFFHSFFPHKKLRGDEVNRNQMVEFEG